MGRHPYLVKDRKIKVRLPGSPRATYQPVSLFWAGNENSHMPLDVVSSAQTIQCYFTKLCGRHTALVSPKSLLHNFHSLRGTTLDCKPCKVFNCAKHAIKPSVYESAAYKAVDALPSGFGIGSSDMLVDHKLHGFGSSLSRVDIYLPTIGLCVVVDNENHFKRTNAGEPQDLIDDRFNAEAISKGLKVLRMHHRDILSLPEVLRDAVSRCRSRKFGHIEYSMAYGAAVRNLT